MTVKIAINGFGRIGRLVLRAACESARDDVEFVAINDLGSVEANAHLFRFDSVHGRFNGEVKVDGDTIDVGRGPIKVTAERDPAKLQEMWVSWHDNVGAPMGKDYARMVEIANQGATELGYADVGAMWRSGYDMP
eukprot:gene8763-10788_t